MKLWPISATRLSALDGSFLTLDGPNSHMHLGFAATLAPPEAGQPPRLPQFVRHIERRLPRAPRYRQMLAPVPLELHRPVWVDDRSFDVSRHVIRSKGGTLERVVSEFMSEPLARDRPLWQICIADRLVDGTIGVVGKVHHCMVDGIAAAELASLLLDPEPDAADPPLPHWQPGPQPGAADLIAGALLDRGREGLSLAATAARVVASPTERGGLDQIPGMAQTFSEVMRPAAPASPLNGTISPARELAVLNRPLASLVAIKDSFGVTLNDVVLSACASGLRGFLHELGHEPIRLKSMVPVNIRAGERNEALGNRLSFMFVDLPCDEPDPVRRLREVHLATSQRKEASQPQAADRLLRFGTYAPHSVQRLGTQLVSSSRTFNLAVSNVPGPREPLYMCGCELTAAYPVVPITDGHALAIGFTTVRDRACFGFYADPESLAEVALLPAKVDESIDELLAKRPAAAEA